ncbi:GNAT family N-acetyltransferase [Mangrovimonas sp. TPBH4]|uniref:GNAT family N-acetyltransferase n=1 Tax=Mangrovimonas sp. TPBH4 TaxID=1645914 RepID=UPI0006B61235|nr:GNAT family N-acetyltransferase [Mangrovimonas sp. TPBH4]
MKAFTIKQAPIPIDIYQDLRNRCGLSDKTEQACSIGLKNALYSVMLEVNGTVVGMGRLVGDGGCFCQVVDICVLPEYQGNGYGKAIMEQISKYIDKHLPSSCYVSLLADRDASILYKKFGFQDTLPISKGMYFTT